MDQSAFTLDKYGFSEEPAFCDWCLGQTVQALIDDGKEETAALLLACRISWRRYTDYQKLQVQIVFHGSISVIRELKENMDSDDPFSEVYLSAHLDPILEVLHLVLGTDVIIASHSFQIEATSLPTQWRQELLELARKKGATNQGRIFSAGKPTLHQYENLSFRSQSEIKIAKALDSKNVMYFANCTARVNQGGDRVNREPDFLICHKGRWGILEVDGEPFHTPSNVAQDHDRDRLFVHHGVTCIQHFDATRCYQEPMQVADEFLALVARQG